MSKAAIVQKNVILYAVLFYVRYAVSYLGLEKTMAKRGVKVDRAILNRWVVKYSPAGQWTIVSSKRSPAQYWLQGIPLRSRDTRWNRGGTYDPKRSIRQNWPIRFPEIHSSR